jgi:5'-nucleotidase
VVGSGDARRGLGAAGVLAEVGGFARLSALVRRERRAAERSLHLDSGDLFQGSLTFDRFGGEPEVLAFEALGVDAQALGNHELDHGARPVVESYLTLARFPLLAANYLEEGEGIGGVVEPFVVLDAAGLRVGVLGVANAGSVSALRERPNQLGVALLEAAGAVQAAIDALRPLADVVIAVTHLGLSADQALVEATSGLDLVLGGHQHIVLDEPVWASDCGGAGLFAGTIEDAWGRRRACTPRGVAIVHSGAYAKFLGKIRLVLDDQPSSLAGSYDPLDRHEVTGLSFEVLPVSADVPEDPALAALLEAYRPVGLDALALDDVLGFAPVPVERNGVTGGDSPLGNLVAEASRRFAETELAVIGASSLRHDLPPGLLDAETLTRVLPFDDPIVRVAISGAALRRAFERAAHAATARDCRTQLHVAGMLVRWACPCAGEGCAALYPAESDIACASDADCAPLAGACGANARCFLPLISGASYALATTAYLAAGGSGLFEPIPGSSAGGEGVLAAVREGVRQAPPCARTTEARACDSGCTRAYAERLRAECEQSGLGDACALAAEVCERAEQLCAHLPCIDQTLAPRDGRIRFEAP